MLARTIAHFRSCRALHARRAAIAVLAISALGLAASGVRAQGSAQAICATTSDPATCQQMINAAVNQGLQSPQGGPSIGQGTIQQLLQGFGQGGASSATVPGMTPAPQPSVVVTPTQPSSTAQSTHEGPSRLEEVYSQRAGTALHQFGYSIIGNGGTVSALQIGAIQDQYILGQGDEIIVTLRGQENATYNVFVDRDGNVTLPKLRPISAAGMRFGDFRREFDAAVRAGYIQTQDYITIGQVRQISVNVVGEVYSPGVYGLSGLSTVLDALNLAGGVKKSGSLRNIMVVRDGHSFRVDLYQFLSLEGHTPDTTIRQGDRIVVAPIGATIAISGEVRRPGIYELNLGERDLSAGALIRLANGYTIRGAYRLTTLRTRPDGKLEYVDNTGHEGAVVRDGEILTVTSAVNYTVGHVTLDGNVREPGDYALNKVRTLHDLLPSAEAFLPLTYTPFGFIMREDKTTLQRSVIPFSVRQLIEGKYNVDLQSDDMVHILTVNAMHQLLAMSLAPRNTEGASFASGASLRTCLAEEEKIRELPRPERARSLTALKLPSCPSATPAQPSFAAQPTTGLLQSLASQLGQNGNAALPGATPASPGASSFGQAASPAGTIAAGAFGAGSQPGAADGAATGLGAGATDASLAGSSAASGSVDGLTADEASAIGFVVSDYRMSLEGGVRAPGDYLAAPGVSLEEMVDAADGLVPDADLNAVEITSVTTDNVAGHSIATRKLYALTPEKLASINVNRLDVVQIPRVPSNQEEGSVSVDGEVQFPGTYHILKGEHLSSLLARAGGLTREAYPLGAVFQRPSVARVQQAAYEREADDLQKQLMASVAQGSGALSSAAGASLGLSPEAAGFLEDVIRELREKPAEGRISIQADPVALAAHPEADIELQPGDQLFIPKHPSEVVVTGEVLNPGSYRFSPSLGVTDYIGLSGGFDRYADDDHIFVINPDGTSRGISDDMFSFTTDRLAPGSVVVVPRDLRPLDLGALTVTVGKVFADFAISAASLAVIAHNNN